MNAPHPAIQAARKRLRRVAHFVPGGQERFLAKALALPADTLILDLEDAVAPEQKASARGAVAEVLGSVDFGGQEATVRMNPLDSPWGLDDLEATMRRPPAAYVVPKASTAADVEAIASTLTRLEREHGHPEGAVALLLVATETPQAVFHLPELAAASRVAGITWGAEDLSAALGASRSRAPDGRLLDVFRVCRSHTLLAAVAAGVQPIDGVYPDFQDTDGFRQHCQEGAWMGYTGVISIHPAQIEVANAVFTPSAAEVDEARALLAAAADAAAEGRGAFRFNGQMVDAPHLARAEGLLVRARAAGVPGA